MNNTNKCGCQNPKCSHNTNGRDLDKPCSIEFRPPQNNSVAVEEVGQEILDRFFSNGATVKKQDWDFLHSRLTKLVEEARADMKAKCLEVLPDKESIDFSYRDFETYMANGRNNYRKEAIAAIQAIPISNE